MVIDGAGRENERTVTVMAEILAEHWIMFLGLFCWVMGYALGYKHGLKDGDRHD